MCNGSLLTSITLFVLFTSWGSCGLLCWCALASLSNFIAFSWLGCDLFTISYGEPLALWRVHLVSCVFCFVFLGFPMEDCRFVYIHVLLQARPDEEELGNKIKCRSKSPNQCWLVINININILSMNVWVVCFGPHISILKNSKKKK